MALKYLRHDDPELASTRYGLGVALLELGRPAEAEPLLRRALEIRLTTRSPGHASVVEARAALARALRASAPLR